MKRDEVEIMAPAGSYDSLMAAIQGGADSVYFGVEKLNMRAGSSGSFTVDDIENIVSICRLYNIKSYITLNVVIYDSELEQMQKIVDKAADCGVTAIIASDISVIRYAFSKGISVHLSTQVNVTNAESLMFFSQWADVAVLARELNIGQIRHIYDSIHDRKITGPCGKPVRIEMFAHGALCMAVSGKCYLSLHENNKSANRGECYQTCRKAYTATEKESGYQLEIDNEYIMSPKDLCTIGFLDRLTDAGVRVLKIEGRARPAEYVKTVVECYSEAIGAIIKGTYSPEKCEQWRGRLATVFNRGFWDGYYLGQTMGEWNTRYGSAATRRKTYLGKITNYFARIGVAEIKLETGDLNIGDTILVTGPTTGVVEYVVSEIRVDLQQTAAAKKGEYCSIPSLSCLRRSDKVYKWTEAGE
ncbi:MAG: U32 family peptidase [Bacteroidales bacterium]|jgi:putative protease|nr:U32 family peptidase [Bacteroidales bacterium]